MNPVQRKVPESAPYSLKFKLASALIPTAILVSSFVAYCGVFGPLSSREEKLSYTGMGIGGTLLLAAIFKIYKHNSHTRKIHKILLGLESIDWMPNQPFEFMCEGKKYTATWSDRASAITCKNASPSLQAALNKVAHALYHRRLRKAVVIDNSYFGGQLTNPSDIARIKL